MSQHKVRRQIEKAMGKVDKSTNAINDGKLTRALDRNVEANEFLVLALDELEKDQQQPPGIGDDDEFEGCCWYCPQCRELLDTDLIRSERDELRTALGKTEREVDAGDDEIASLKGRIERILINGME